MKEKQKETSRYGHGCETVVTGVAFIYSDMNTEIFAMLILRVQLFFSLQVHSRKQTSEITKLNILFRDTWHFKNK